MPSIGPSMPQGIALTPDSSTSRLNIAVTGPGSDVPELADESFGASLISTQPIVVERSMYTDANGVTWAAGTNATGTRIP